MRPERSEGQGLESLAGIYRVIPLEQTTRYAGGHDWKISCVQRLFQNAKEKLR